MIDSSIQRLLEQAIDSPTKLQLSLLFYENRRLEGTAAQFANRIYQDIWSTREALRELTEDGILIAANLAGESIYRYRPRPEHVEAIALLAQSYNEPLERDAIQRAVREAASYASYRRTSHTATAFERQAL
ncbi:MAG: hypothetical protein IPO81_01490 [Kouleothrix sp.]|nr:hypothetical protein [Kouleothrix sp.]